MKYVEVMTYLTENGHKVCRYTMTEKRAISWQRKLAAQNKVHLVAKIGGEYKTREEAEKGGYAFPEVI